MRAVDEGLCGIIVGGCGGFWLGGVGCRCLVVMLVGMAMVLMSVCRRAWEVGLAIMVRTASNRTLSGVDVTVWNWAVVSWCV